MNESNENAPPKSAKQLEKEAKKLAKLEKFKQKQELKTKAPAVPAEVRIRFSSFVKSRIRYRIAVLLFRKRKRRKKFLKKTSNIRETQRLVIRKMFPVRCRKLIVLLTSKPLGIPGGRRKDFSNRNTEYVDGQSVE